MDFGNVVIAAALAVAAALAGAADAGMPRAEIGWTTKQYGNHPDSGNGTPSCIVESAPLTFEYDGGNGHTKTADFVIRGYTPNTDDAAGTHIDWFTELAHGGGRPGYKETEAEVRTDSFLDRFRNRHRIASADLWETESLGVKVSWTMTTYRAEFQAARLIEALAACPSGEIVIASN